MESQHIINDGSKNTERTAWLGISMIGLAGLWALLIHWFADVWLRTDMSNHSGLAWTMVSCWLCLASFLIAGLAGRISCYLRLLTSPVLPVLLAIGCATGVLVTIHDVNCAHTIYSQIVAGLGFLLVSAMTYHIVASLLNRTRSPSSWAWRSLLRVAGCVTVFMWLLYADSGLHAYYVPWDMMKDVVAGPCWKIPWSTWVLDMVVPAMLLGLASAFAVTGERLTNVATALAQTADVVWFRVVRPRHVLLGLVVFVALLLALDVVCPLWGAPVKCGDEGGYDEFGQAICLGAGYSSTTYMPLFLMWLGGIYYFFGHFTWAVQVGNILCILSTVVVCYASVRVWTGSTATALMSALLISTCRSLHIYAWVPLTEPFNVFLSTLSIYCLVRTIADARPRNYLLWGLSMASVFLTRSSNIGLLIGQVVVYGISTARATWEQGGQGIRRQARGLSLALLALTVPMVCLGLYRVYKIGKFRVTDDRGALSLLSMNMPGVHKGNHPKYMWLLLEEWDKEHPRATDSEMTKAALEFMAADPVRTLTNMSWRGLEFMGLRGRLPGTGGTWSELPLHVQVYMAPLCMLLGLVCFRNRLYLGLWIILALFAVPIVLIYAETRYHYPLLALLILSIAGWLQFAFLGEKLNCLAGSLMPGKVSWRWNWKLCGGFGVCVALLLCCAHHFLGRPNYHRRLYTSGATSHPKVALVSAFVDGGDGPGQPVDLVCSVTNYSSVRDMAPTAQRPGGFWASIIRRNGQLLGEPERAIVYFDGAQITHDLRENELLWIAGHQHPSEAFRAFSVIDVSRAEKVDTVAGSAVHPVGDLSATWLAEGWRSLRVAKVSGSSEFQDHPAAFACDQRVGTSWKSQRIRNYGILDVEEESALAEYRDSANGLFAKRVLEVHGPLPTEQLTLDLEEVRSVGRLRWIASGDAIRLAPREYAVDVSVDGFSWKRVHKRRDCEPREGCWNVVLLETQCARYVRFEALPRPNSSTDFHVQIAEMAVDQFDATTRRVALSWTAPATGLACGYEVRWSERPIMTEDQWRDAEKLYWELPPAAPGGTRQSAVIEFPDRAGPSKAYIAVRARDGLGRLSPISSSEVMPLSTAVVAN